MTQLTDPHTDPATGTSTLPPVSAAKVVVTYVCPAHGAVEEQDHGAADRFLVAQGATCGILVTDPSGKHACGNIVQAHYGVDEQAGELQPNPAGAFTPSAGAMGNATKPTS